MSQPEPDLRFGSFLLSVRNRRLARDGETVPLTPKAFETLLCLLSSDGAVVEKQALMKTVWGDVFVDDSTLTQNIFTIRKALGDGSYIETVPRLGYRFTVPVTAVPQPKPVSEGPRGAWGGRPFLLWGIAAGLVAVALGLAGFAILRTKTRSELPVRLNLTFDGLTAEENAVPLPAPDGSKLAFLAFDASRTQSLWLRPLSSQTATRLAGTEGATQPFWSPDGQWIGFYADGKLKKVSPGKGAPQAIADLPGLTLGATWNQQGDVIFSPGHRTPLYRLSAIGGKPEQLTSLDTSRAENSHRYPRFLPDGRRFLFVARSGSKENNALYLGSLGSAQPRRLMAIESNVSYIPAGDGRGGALLYARDEMLVEQAFDGENVSGEPEPVVEKVEYHSASLVADFGASKNGSVLIFRPAGSALSQFRWFDRKGAALSAVGPPGDYMNPRISPDGSRVLYSRSDTGNGNRDVWFMELSGGLPSRLTTDPANDYHAVWGPGGRGIAFSSDRQGGPRHSVYLKSSMEPGSGETVLDTGGMAGVSEDWSKSGKWIALRANPDQPPSDLWIVPASGDRTGAAKITSRFREQSARFSPDERWIAYVSNETGRYEVYVRPLAGGRPAADRKIRVSNEGGDYPVWRGDGSELFFVGGDMKIYALPSAGLGLSVVQTPKAPFEACADTALAGLPMRETPYYHPFDVSPDGQRFLINCRAIGPGRFDVLLNWRSRRP